MIPAKSLTVPNKEDAVALDSFGTLITAVGAFIVSPLAESAQESSGTIWGAFHVSSLAETNTYPTDQKGPGRSRLVDHVEGLSDIEDHKPCALHEPQDLPARYVIFVQDRSICLDI